MKPCLEHQGYRDKDGYGRVYNPRTKRQAPAHRKAYEDHHDVILPEDVVVRHTCDNPPCIEPEHLVAGTQAQNMADMMRRGRLGRRKGEGNIMATVADTAVSECRRLYTGARGELTELARRYGVSRPTVTNWIRGDTRCHT